MTVLLSSANMPVPCFVNDLIADFVRTNEAVLSGKLKKYILSNLVVNPFVMSFFLCSCFGIFEVSMGK